MSRVSNSLIDLLGEEPEDPVFEAQRADQEFICGVIHEIDTTNAFYLNDELYVILWRDSGSYIRGSTLPCLAAVNTTNPPRTPVFEFTFDRLVSCIMSDRLTFIKLEEPVI